MKVALIGSGSFRDYDQLEKKLNKFGVSEVVSAGVKGPDHLAEIYAISKGLKYSVLKTHHNEDGRGTDGLRNWQISEKVDMIIAFWDGRSKETIRTIRHAMSIGKFVVVFPPMA